MQETLPKSYSSFFSHSERSNPKKLLMLILTLTLESANASSELLTNTTEKSISSEHKFTITPLSDESSSTSIDTAAQIVFIAGTSCLLLFACALFLFFQYQIFCGKSETNESTPINQPGYAVTV